ncbi:MAG: DUF1566 domain-containing protein [Pseudomonadota bacterium]
METPQLKYNVTKEGKKMNKRLIILLLLMLVPTANISFAYLVDTGQPPIPTGSNGWSYHSNTLSLSWLAAEFTLGQASTITGIETYMINRAPGTATVVIYADKSDGPDENNPLFKHDFSTSILPLGLYGWYGVSGLDWDLPAGTYWAAFEAIHRDGFYSCMPWDAPNPMDNYVAYNEAYGVYGSSNSANFGFRISGANNPVSEPATILPISMGISGSFSSNEPVTVTVTASGSGAENAYYKFFYCPNYGTPSYDTSPWVVMREYSTANTCEYTFPSDGSYIVVARTVADPANEPVDLPIIGGVVTIGDTLNPRITLLSSDLIGAVPPNSPVTYTIDADSAGTNMYYKWFYRAGYGTAEYEEMPWVVVKDYSTETSCTYTFPSEGNYIVVARAVTDPSSEPADLLIIGATVACNSGTSGAVQRIPDTGQTTSYTDTFGEDSDYAINPQSYTKLGASGNDLPDTAVDWAMVRDNITGLIWENKTDDGSIHDKDNKYTWYDPNPETNKGVAGTSGNGSDSQDFIDTLNSSNFGGYSDWRLPSIKELATLRNWDKTDPSISTLYFSNTISSEYWSSTTAGNSVGNCASTIDFKDGTDGYSFKNPDSNYVRAVRGVQAGIFDDSIVSGRMVDNGDGTVSDTKSGLMWQQIPEEMAWNGALSYCENLQLSGYDDWRLPNINELRSLVDYSVIDPTIDIVAFPHTRSYCWSSTVYNSGDPVGIYFSFGYEFTTNKDYDYLQVLAVRGGSISLQIRTWYQDTDGDKYSDGTTQSATGRPGGYYLASELTQTSGDRDDNDSNIHPGATEVCGDGIDQDCNGVDEACADTNTDEASVRNFIAAIETYINNNDASGFFAMFAEDYLHNGKDLDALTDEIDLSSIQSFTFTISSIDISGGIAKVVGTCDLRNKDGSSQAWAEPESENGIGWLKMTTDGWKIYGNQTPSDVWSEITEKYTLTSANTLTVTESTNQGYGYVSFSRTSSRLYFAGYSTNDALVAGFTGLAMCILKFPIIEEDTWSESGISNGYTLNMKVTVKNDSEQVTVPAGTFTCVVTVEQVTAPAGYNDNSSYIKEYKRYFAPGVGVVKVVDTWANGDQTIGELQAYSVFDSDASDYFPMNIGDWWQFSWKSYL